jgi:GNAT superfamily N-acetyltransferase
LSVSLTVETSSLSDLELLRTWTTWSPDSGLPCAVGQDRPHQTFVDGKLRVVSAWNGTGKVGVSLVAAPTGDPSGVRGWRVPSVRFVPASECLLWVGLAIAPEFRRSGLALELIRSTLETAVMTGYPYVLALFPISDARAASLLSRAGFTAASPFDANADRGYMAYLRSTPSLASTR